MKVKSGASRFGNIGAETESARFGTIGVIDRTAMIFPDRLQTVPVEDHLFAVKNGIGLYRNFLLNRRGDDFVFVLQMTPEFEL